MICSDQTRLGRIPVYCIMFVHVHGEGWLSTPFLSWNVRADPDIQHLPFMAISPKFFKSLYSVYHDRIMYYDLLGRCLVSVQHLLFYPIM